MTAVATDVTDGNEDSQIEFDVRKSGTLTKVWTITSSDAGAMSFDMNVDALTIGSGADTDISLTFDANSADGVITWMEDEDYFQFSDDILMSTTEKIQLRDTAIYIYSSTDGQLDLVADTEIQIAATTVDINGAVAFDGALTGITNITLSGTLSDGNYTFDTSGNVSGLGTVGSGAITSSGIIKTDDTTEATSTTDGSLQTDGGLSVVKDAVFGDDVSLLSDSAVFNMGAGNDFTITHDGTTGATIVGNPLTLDSGAAINLEPASGSAILLDGTISVDAGVVTGATSITSTAFVGTIDGVVGGNTPAAITGTTIDATTDFTIGSTVITDDSIVMTPSTSDTVTIAGATHGILNITTVDAAATAADVNIDADGEIVIDAADAAGSIFKIAGTAQLSIIDGEIRPTTDNDIDLGSSSYQFKDAYINGTLEADAITIGGTNVVTGSLVTTLGTISAGVWQGTAIASSYIAGDAITGAKIADDAIDSEHYAAASIDNEHLADNAVDTAEIADNAVTLAKMAGLARGKLIYGDASGDPAALAVGSADQVLTHDGTDLAWASAGGGGGGTASFTADGSIAAGEAVGLTAAGKVTSISGMGPQYRSDNLPVEDFTSVTVEQLGKIVYCGSTGKVAYVGYWSNLSSYGYVVIGEYSTTTKEITWGTPVIFHSGSVSNSTAAVWDENVDRLVILYSNSSDDAGTSLVYEISASGNTVVVSDGGGEYGPGTAQTFEAGATKNITADFDSGANKIIIFYEDDADSDYGKAVIGTVTGGSTNTMANTAAEKYNGDNATYGHTVKWDYDNDLGLLAFMDGGDSNYTKCLAFTHDGSNYTFGTIIEPFGANQLVYVHDGWRTCYTVSFDSSNDNFVIIGAWADGDGDDVLRAVAVSVSGTTCTEGTAVVLQDKPQSDDGTQDVAKLSGSSMSIEYDPDRDVHLVVIAEHSKNRPDFTRGDDGRAGEDAYQTRAYQVTLSGTGDRTVDDPGEGFNITGAGWVGNVPWSSGAGQYPRLAYDTTNNVMHFLAWIDVLAVNPSTHATIAKETVATFHGATAALAYAQSTMDKFIGFNTSALADAATATITVKGGINENQSSLTAGQHYYISDDGKLTTTKPWASQFLYRAGIATAATKLIVQNDWYGG